MVEDAARGTGTGGFVWPPLPLPEEGVAGGEGVRVAVHKRATRGRRWWDALVDFERVWLDPVAEPFARRAEAVGWKADGFEVYCDRCGHDVAAFEASEFGCARCRDMRPSWERFVRLGAYEPPLSLWVQEVKFTRHHALACALGRVLGKRLIASGAREWGDVVVTPVPTTLRRRLSRGIDHAGMLAWSAAREIGAPSRRLLRRGHRASQRSVAPSARAANVRGAIRLAARAPVEGRRVVLVDDVSTSGATLRACARVLRAGGAAGVWVACVAVTREAGRGDGGGEDGQEWEADVDKWGAGGGVEAGGG